MSQTPAHEFHNPDLLRLIPTSSKSLIEIGCSSGALAREFKLISPECDYFGIEIDPNYAALARRFCDKTICLDIEDAGEDFFISNRTRDCWIFGDTLEHLKNPYGVLDEIRKVIPQTGSVVACIPNAQHWSIQLKLSVGDFRYEETGLLDKTHLRWFTRQTIMEMFKNSGFEVIEGHPRIFNEPARERFLPIIGEMAKLAGSNPNIAINDSLPLQYVVRAVPV